VDFTIHSDSAARLYAELPDAPRWIETRGMLRSPHVTVAGGASVADGCVVRLVHGAISVVSIVGCPPAAAIVSSLDGLTAMTPLLAQIDNADYVERVLVEPAASRDVEGWHRERVIVHELTSFPELRPLDADVAVRLLAPDDLLEHLPPGLRHELTHARTTSSVAAAFVDNVPVSFCYACWTSESLWDVSIDTLPAYRRHGLAAHVVRFTIAHFGRDGREPVWSALESNGVSLRLAERLGFAPVDETVAFSRGPWAFFSGGFNG
jgi:GNAT superfamily N-acetyltransferase